MSAAASSSSSLGFFGALTLLFIGLKLAKFIGWSWWWVLSPMWISFGIFIIILILAVILNLFDD